MCGLGFRRGASDARAVKASQRQKHPKRYENVNSAYSETSSATSEIPARRLPKHRAEHRFKREAKPFPWPSPCNDPPQLIRVLGFSSSLGHPQLTKKPYPAPYSPQTAPSRGHVPEASEPQNTHPPPNLLALRDLGVLPLIAAEAPCWGIAVEYIS